MIRIERDPAFWAEVASHPAVSSLLGPLEGGWSDFVIMPNVIPLAATHGGFIFARADSFGRVYELHTLFTPEGWGREVHGAAKEAFNHVFAAGADLVITHEIGENPRSQPPRSFGFKQAANFSTSPFGNARLWFLSADAWRASPAWRKSCQ